MLDSEPQDRRHIATPLIPHVYVMRILTSIPRPFRWPHCTTSLQVSCDVGPVCLYARLNEIFMQYLKHRGKCEYEDVALGIHLYVMVFVYIQYSCNADSIGISNKIYLHLDITVNK